MLIGINGGYFPAICRVCLFISSATVKKNFYASNDKNYQSVEVCVRDYSLSQKIKIHFAFLRCSLVAISDLNELLRGIVCSLHYLSDMYLVLFVSGGNIRESRLCSKYFGHPGLNAR